MYWGSKGSAWLSLAGSARTRAYPVAEDSGLISYGAEGPWGARAPEAARGASRGPDSAGVDGVVAQEGKHTAQQQKIA